MSVFEVLRHQWKRRWRSATWGRSLLATILLTLVSAYLGALFVGVGWFYPDVIAQIAPDRTPLRLLNTSLLYGVVGLVVFRFVLQRSAGSDVRAYLPLPIRPSQFVRVLQVISALSLFNVLPLVLLGTLWGSTVLPVASPVGAAYWAVGGVLAVACTQVANSLLRALWNRNARLVLGGAVGLVLLGGAVDAAGGDGVSRISAWLFGGLSAGRLRPLSVLAGATVVGALGAHRALRAQLYDVLEGTSGSGSRWLRLGRRWGQSRMMSLVLLDIRLIFRNKRPRQMLMIAVAVIGFFVYLFVAEGGAADAFTRALQGFLLSGYLVMMYGQFSYSWHGDHFDALLIRVSAPRTLVQAQFVTLAGLCAGPCLMVLPVVFWVAPEFIGPLVVFLMYNVGVTVPFLLCMGTWRRTSLHLNQTAFFNYQGTVYHFYGLGVLGILLIAGTPIGLMVGLDGAGGLFLVAALGGVGLCTIPLWTRGLGRLLRWQRHAMAVGFRETD